MTLAVEQDVQTSTLTLNNNPEFEKRGTRSLCVYIPVIPLAIYTSPKGSIFVCFGDLGESIMSDKHCQIFPNIRHRYFFRETVEFNIP